MTPALAGPIPSARYPIAGVHYPGTPDEFERWFPDEAACRLFLEGLKWPDGFVCPSCGRPGQPWRMANARLACPSCRGRTTVTAHTTFDKTRTNLQKWFVAAWLFTTSRHQGSANYLYRHLGLHSAETTWAMLHRFRRVMDERYERGPLEGQVRLCLTSIPTLGRSKEPERQTVLIGIERLEKGIGRIRMRRIQDDRDDLLRVVSADVAAGSVVFLSNVDSWPHLSALYDIRPAPESRTRCEQGNGMAHAFSGWLARRYQVVPQDKYLDGYLQEFVFRFNRRNVANRGLLCYRLLQQATESGPCTVSELTGSESTDRRADQVTEAWDSLPLPWPVRAAE